MVFKGLLVVVSGFLFIFASGVPMRLIARFRPDYKREGIYWGIAIWGLAFFVSNFLQSLLKQVFLIEFDGNQLVKIISFVFSTLFLTLLVQIGMQIYLKFHNTLIIQILAWVFLFPLTLFLFLFAREKKQEDIISSGLALGFGIGLIAQVFTGMILITAGAGVLLQGLGVILPEGIFQKEMLDVISKESLFGLAAALLSLVLFRVALLIISASQGYLVAGSALGKKWQFWIALLGYSAFSWLIFFLQMLFGDQNPGQVSLGLTQPVTSVISAVYYLTALILGYRWLSEELRSADKEIVKPRSKK